MSGRNPRKARRQSAATWYALQCFKAEMPTEFAAVRQVALNMLEQLRGPLPPKVEYSGPGFKRTARLDEQAYRARRVSNVALRYLRAHRQELYDTWRREYLERHP